MKKGLRYQLAMLGALGALAASATADTAFDAPGNANPLVPGYFADPTIKQFGDIYHLYATTDGNGGGRGPATVWVSKNFVDWVLVRRSSARTWPACRSKSGFTTPATAVRAATSASAISASPPGNRDEVAPGIS